MHITKVPSRRPTEPPQALGAFLHVLEECPTEDIPRLVSEFGFWSFSRSDLYLWVNVLNRFDNILADVVAAQKFELMLCLPLLPATQKLLTAILRFSRLLLENCSNRSLYSSFEHLNSLLCSGDLDVVEHTLWVLLRSAQRAFQLRSFRLSSTISQERLIVLALALISSDERMTTMLSPEYVVLSQSTGVDFSFYRLKTASENEGFCSISLAPEQVQASEDSWLPSLVEQYAIPFPGKDAYHGTWITQTPTPGFEQAHPVFELHRKLIIAKNISDPAGRQKLILSRVLALAIVVHLPLSDEQHQRIFSHDLINDIAELLSFDALHSWRLKTAAVYAADGIINLRSKLQELLLALNVSVSHGVLLSIIRRIITDLAVAPFSGELGEYFDAIHTICLRLVALQNSGGMLLNAGLLSVLVLVFDCIPENFRLATKVVNLIDTIVYGFQTAFTIFFNCQGLQKLVSRIKSEVECLQGEVASSEIDRINWVKALMRFAFHLMQVVSSPEIRNLIDSSLPASLLQIFQGVSNAQVLSVAIHIVSNFIHNEPTCLPILQDLRLPQTMIDMIATCISPNVDLMNAIPTSFGAVCLNRAGVEYLQQSRAIENFMLCFTSLEHARLLLESEQALVIGNGIDEFIRHQPSFSANVLEAIMSVIKIIAENGMLTKPSFSFSKKTPEDQHVSKLVLHSNPHPDPQTKESDMKIFVGALCKFFDGLSHPGSNGKAITCKVYAAELVQFCSFPCFTYDLSSSSAFSSISRLVGIYGDNDAKNSCAAIASALKAALDSLVLVGYESCLAPANEAAAVMADSYASDLSKVLIHLCLMCQIYTPPSWPKRHNPSLVQQLYNDFGDDYISKLVSVHKHCLLQLISMRSTVGAMYFNGPTTKAKSSNNTFHFPAELQRITGTLQPPAPSAPVAREANASVQATITEIHAANVQTSALLAADQQQFRIENQDSLLVPPTHHLDTNSPFYHAQQFANRLQQAHLGSQQQQYYQQQQQYYSGHHPMSNRHIETWGARSLAEPIHALSFIAPTVIEEQKAQNIRYLKDLYHQIHISVSAFLGCISRMLVCKRSSEQPLKKCIRQVASGVITACGIYFQSDENLKLGINDKDYFQQIAAIYAEILIQDRDRFNLQAAMFYYALKANQLEDLFSRTTDPISTEIFLQILASATTPKNVIDAQSAQALVDLKNFDFVHILVAARATAFDYLGKLTIKDTQRSTASLLLRILTHLMKGESERPIGRLRTGIVELLHEAVHRSSPLAQQQPARAVVADPGMVPILTEMGFSPVVSELALIRCQNNVQRAADYILAHPELDFGSHAPTSSVATSTEPILASVPNNIMVLAGPSRLEEEAVAPADLAEQASVIQITTTAVETTISEAVSHFDAAATGEPIHVAISSMELDDGTSTLPIEISDADAESFLFESPLVQSIATVRASFQPIASEIIFQILSERNSLLVECRDVLLLVSEAEGINAVFEKLDQNLPVALSLIGALMTENPKKKTVIQKLLNFQQQLIDIFLQDPATRKFPAAIETIWPPLLLIFESLFQFIQEPLPREFPRIVGDEIKIFSAAKNETRDAILPVLTQSVQMGMAKRLLWWVYTTTVQVGTPLVGEGLVDRKKTMESVLRLLVRFFKDPEICRNVLELYPDPIELLSKCEPFALVIVLIRLLIENSDKKSFAQILHSEIQKFLERVGTPRLQQIETSMLIDHCNWMALREPSLFIEEIMKFFKVGNYENNSPRNFLLQFKGDLTSKLAPPFLENTVATRLMEGLVQKLLSLSGKKDTEGPGEVHTTRIFLMKSISELALSYTPCKIALVEKQMPRRRGSSASSSPHQTQLKIAAPSKAGFVTYVVENLIPWPGVHTEADLSNDVRMRLFESQWSSTILTCLCVNSDGDEVERDLTAPIHHVRQYVIEALHRAYTAPAPADVDARYGRYLALADTVHRILAVPAKKRKFSPANNAPTANANSVQEIVPTLLVKCLLERDFVSLLTDMLAKVDTHHPQAKFIVSSILKPIEILTQLSVKLSKIKSPLAPSTLSPNSDHVAPATETQSSLEHAAQDALRHSSLGIMEGHDDIVMDEDEQDEIDDDEDDEDGYDDNMSHEDLSEMSDEEPSPMNMGIIIQQSHPHELLAEHNHEQNQLHRRRIGSLRHHDDDLHPDRDDDDDDDEDDDDDDDDDIDGEDDGDGEDSEDGEEITTHNGGGLQMDIDQGTDTENNHENFAQFHGDFESEDGDEDDEDENENEDDDDDDENDNEDNDENGQDVNIDEDEDGDENDEDSQAVNAAHAAHVPRESGESMETDEVALRPTVRDFGAREHPSLQSILNMGVPPRVNISRMTAARLYDLQLLGVNGGTDAVAQAMLQSMEPDGDEDPFENFAEGEEDDEENSEENSDFFLHANFGWVPHGMQNILDVRIPLLGELDRLHPQNLTHPVLSASQNRNNIVPLNQASMRVRSRAEGNPAGHTNSNAYRQVFDGHGADLLQQFISRASANHTGALEIQLNYDPLTDRRFVVNNCEPIFHDFKPQTTSERWKYICQLLYGNNYQEHASRVIPLLQGAFMPQALEQRVKQEKERQEQIASEKAEDERLRLEKDLADKALAEAKACAEKAQAEAEAQAQALEQEQVQVREADSLVVASSSSDAVVEHMEIVPEIMEENQGAAVVATTIPQQSPPPHPAAAALAPTTSQAATNRFVASIGGTMIDLTNSGIDPTFFDALPDELREEVLLQYITEMRQSALDRSFLENAAATLAADGGSARAIANDVTTHAGTSSRAASTPRVTDGDRPAGSSATTAAAATATTATATATTGTTGVDGGTPANVGGGILVPKEPQKDAPRLLNKAHINTVVGMLFVDVPIAKPNLLRLLVTLCESSKSRNDIFGILMKILSGGGEGVRFGKLIRNNLTAIDVCHRCFEILTRLVRQNKSFTEFFFIPSAVTPKRPPRVLAELSSPHHHGSGGAESGHDSNFNSIQPTPLLMLIGLLSKVQFVEENVELLCTIAKNGMENTTKITEHAVRSLLSVMESECPIKTFQNLLVVVQSFYEHNAEIFVNELVRSVNATVLELLGALEDLRLNMETATAENEIFKQFSHPASLQARLLRLLKTTDCLTSKHATELPALEIAPLWHKLSECLGKMETRDELASLLLSLIESFMVVESRVHSPFFGEFTESNRRLLNVLVRNNPSLLSGSFSILVRNAKVLEFDNKRNYFYQQLHAQKQRRQQQQHGFAPINLNVRRSFVFEDSYHQMQHKSGDEIKNGKIVVRFYEEEGVDGGGLTREWFCVLARQIFNPDYALFKTSAVDKATYQPNRASWVNPEHLQFFKFVGRFIGKAVYDQRLLDCYFTRSFYKHILNKSVDIKDMEAVDPEYFKSLQWMLANSIENVFDLTFSMEIDDFGRTKILDLCPNGRNIEVSDENKHDYVRFVVEQRLTKAIQDQVSAFLLGFYEIVHKDLVRIFNEQELELLISGLPEIDVDDWKNNTEYVNYSAGSQVVQLFWRAVRSFDQEQRAKLVQYCTGTSRVPLEGFKALQGSSGAQRFQLVRDPGGVHRLPSAHTCFNQLDLPEYETYEQLRSRILRAIDAAAEGFGLA